MKEGLKGTDSAIREAISEFVSKTDKDAAGIARSVAKKAVANQVSFDEKALRKVLDQMYRDGGFIGVATTGKELGSLAADTELARAGAGIDWATWTPGSPVAADLIGHGNLADTLKALDKTIKGVSDSTMKRIGNTIADGLKTGTPSRDISTQLRDAVAVLRNDPQRAMTIAVTETNRAYNGAAVDSYTQAGLTQFEWMDYEGACDICAELAGVHDIGDEPPPEHPNCRCAILGVIPDS